ncbi:MAG: hypothetical protein ACI906_004161 [Candidatus Latescibacterota bacterium]
MLLLLCKSDHTLRRAFYAGYGIEDQDLNGELENRIMTYPLLHRYCNLHWSYECAATTRRDRDPRRSRYPMVRVLRP